MVGTEGEVKVDVAVEVGVEVGVGVGVGVEVGVEVGALRLRAASGGATLRADGLHSWPRSHAAPQILRAVWCSSSAISPSLKNRTVPVVWETVMATAFVSRVAAAAALWRAPRPMGSFRSFENVWR